MARRLRRLSKNGRLEKGMPKFDLPQEQISDIAAYLHSMTLPRETHCGTRVWPAVECAQYIRARGSSVRDSGRGRSCFCVLFVLMALFAKLRPRVIHSQTRRLDLCRVHLVPSRMSREEAPTYTRLPGMNFQSLTSTLQMLCWRGETVIDTFRDSPGLRSILLHPTRRLGGSSTSRIPRYTCGTSA